MNFVRAYDYLTQARARLFDWIGPLNQEQYTQAFPFGLGTLRATMLEIAWGEWVYTQRLQGIVELPPREDWPYGEDRPPTFRELEAAWTDQALRTRQALASIADWETTVEYRPAGPDRTSIVAATKGDLATQLCFHEIHHRAQAMAMLRQLGVPAQDLDYSILVFRRREEPA